MLASTQIAVVNEQQSARKEHPNSQPGEGQTVERSLTILTEEVGEVAEACLRVARCRDTRDADKNWDGIRSDSEKIAMNDLYRELSQVSAFVVTWMDNLSILSDIIKEREAQIQQGKERLVREAKK